MASGRCMATVGIEQTGDRWAMTRTSGVRPFASSDPDTAADLVDRRGRPPESGVSACIRIRCPACTAGIKRSLSPKLRRMTRTATSQQIPRDPVARTKLGLR
jgi:hypothetical protein